MMPLFLSIFIPQMQRLHNFLRLYKQMNNTIEQLIEGCLKEKRTSQLILYQQFARRLYITCLRIIGNSTEAEEAMQDSFLKIFTRIGQYQQGQCFEAWMHRIAVHTAIDYVRKQTSDWVELSDNQQEATEEEIDDETVAYSVERVRKGLDLLPAGYRVILSLYLFEGYDMEEIATIMEIKPASVRSQYLRGKRKLLNLLTN